MEDSRLSFQRGALEEQFLILRQEIKVAGNLFGELLDHIHRTGQQVVELLHLICLAHRQLLVVAVIQTRGIRCGVHMAAHQRRDQ